MRYLFQLSNKEIFLNNLKGINKKYKRYLGSPLRYVGGKSWAVGYVIENSPDNIKRVISPFFGGGSVEIAFAKELNIPVLGYDIFDILVNYWKFQIEKPQEMYNELVKLQPNQETFLKIKKELKEHWEGKKILEPFKLAVYFYFNHNLSYGPAFLGWLSSIYNNNYQKYLSLIERVKNFNVKNITVECASFEEVIPEFQYDFLYCDPPYYIGSDSSVFKGLYPQNNFPIFHKNFNHKLLRDLLYNHKGKFILSYNDSPTIREWYKDYRIVEIQFNYTLGQGEKRIGENRKNKNGEIRKKAVELLIIKN